MLKLILFLIIIYIDLICIIDYNVRVDRRGNR